MHYYRVAGLSVASEIELPGAIPTRPAPEPEVTVGAGPVPQALPEAGTHGLNWEMCAGTDGDPDGARFLLRVPGIARFLLTAGRDIRFEADAGIGPADIAIFLLGTAFGILLHQRGQIVLHASAVRVGGSAVLFCGASGAGKSSLAAALAQRGFPVVTDDFCALDFDGADAPVVQSDGRQLKLWAQTIAAPLARAATRRTGAASNCRNSMSSPTCRTARRCRSARSISCARRGRRTRSASSAPTWWMPRCSCGAMPTARCWYGAWISAPTISAPPRRSRTPAGMFHLTRPLDFKSMPEVIAMLEQHWAELALTEAAA